MSGHVRSCVRAWLSIAAVLWLACAGPVLLRAQSTAPQADGSVEQALRGGQDAVPAGEDPRRDVERALVRLPLAALLGAALALRPRRKGTPERTPAVVQTQIILAVVGAVIMLIVGASLARAFGIVGAANLIRYRSKIDDPKDAGVMLCALAVGLASGVGLYALAVVSTVFLVIALAAIESFEPHAFRQYSLELKAGDETARLRPQVEALLQRYGCEYELRTMAADALSYDVKVPLDQETERLTMRLRDLGPGETVAVEWQDKKKGK